jgi:hypothetical protein
VDHLIQNDKITKVIINSELLGDIPDDSFNLIINDTNDINNTNSTE